MTKREAKRRILHALIRTLDNDVISGNAFWPFEDENGEPITDAGEERMVEAAQALIDEFDRRRGTANSQSSPDKK